MLFQPLVILLLTVRTSCAASDVAPLTHQPAYIAHRVPAAIGAAYSHRRHVKHPHTHTQPQSSISQKHLLDALDKITPKFTTKQEQAYNALHAVILSGELDPTRQVLERADLKQIPVSNAPEWGHYTTLSRHEFVAMVESGHFAEQFTDGGYDFVAMYEAGRVRERMIMIRKTPDTDHSAILTDYTAQDAKYLGRLYIKDGDIASWSCQHNKLFKISGGAEGRKVFESEWKLTEDKYTENDNVSMSSAPGTTAWLAVKVCILILLFWCCTCGWIGCMIGILAAQKSYLSDTVKLDVVKYV